VEAAETVGAAADPRPTGRVAQINVSTRGVPKLPVDAAMVTISGLEGDGHSLAPPAHGGWEKAVSLYSVESLARVARDGHTAFPGAYGENLTLEGIEMGDLAVADRLAIGGELLIELTGRAEPCQTIAHWFVERRIARIGSRQHPEDTRWYARVVRPGVVRPGDSVRVEGR
jgi:MOSC domain-containing protein YiiM